MGKLSLSSFSINSKKKKLDSFFFTSSKPLMLFTKLKKDKLSKFTLTVLKNRCCPVNWTKEFIQVPS